MKRFIRELLWWALSIAFAGVMLVGFFAEISVGALYEGFVKVALSFVGFVGCTWASNKTSLGRKVCGDSFDL